MTAKVYVTLKKAVLDPQGKAVERSLAQLGLRIGSLKHFLRRPAGRALPSIPRRRPRGPPGSCVPPRAPPQPASAACAGAGQAPLLGGAIQTACLIAQWRLLRSSTAWCRPSTDGSSPPL